jgi:outer membrane biosynthesis protein TonB
MAGGGRTYYATGAGRFSKGSEIRAESSAMQEATRKGELRIRTSFGTTTKAPTGTMSKEELTKVLRSGDTVKFGDGTSVKVTAANKVATINRLVSEGQRQITPAPARTGSILGGQFRGQPTTAPKPAQPAKPAPRGQPKPAAKPAGKPTPKPAGKPTPRTAGKPSPKPTAPKPAPKPAPSTTPTKKGGNNGGKNNPPAKSPAKPTTKGGKDGGRSKGSKKGSGFISSAGVVNTGNRRKGGGGKKDRAKGKAKPRRKGGRSGRGRKK